MNNAPFGQFTSLSPPTKSFPWQASPVATAIDPLTKDFKAPSTASAAAGEPMSHKKPVARKPGTPSKGLSDFMKEEASA